jgi:hypothetical protein
MKQPNLPIDPKTDSNFSAKIVAVAFNNARIPEKAMKELTFIAEIDGKKLALTPDGNFAIVKGDRCIGAVLGEEVFRMVLELFRRR